MLISLTNLAAMRKIQKNIWNKVRLVSLININTKEWQNKPPFMKVVYYCCTLRRIIFPSLRESNLDLWWCSCRSALSFAWCEWFSCKGKEWKIYYCGLIFLQNLNCEIPTSSFDRLRQRIALKSMPQVQHDYFFVASSFLIEPSDVFTFGRTKCKWRWQRRDIFLWV